MPQGLSWSQGGARLALRRACTDWMRLLTAASASALVDDTAKLTCPRLAASAAASARRLPAGRRWPGAEVSTYSAASRRQEGFGKTKRIRSGVGPLAWQGW